MHNGGSRPASGGGSAETSKNTGSERTAHRMHVGSSRAASGGGETETRKMQCFWAIEHVLFVPNRMQIGADLRHRVFEGVAKMRRRGS
jgi:hypothetical protein